MLFYVNALKEKSRVSSLSLVENIGKFQKLRSCARHPNFLNKLKIPQPIAIDLSQQQHKGLAFLYGQGLSQALHLKTWEKFDHFSTYALDPKGTMYLTPMPYISIKEQTFEFQKNIYKLDTNSGNLSVWMTLDEVKAGSNNPYGVIALVYDCTDDTLWVSAIDKTDYRTNRGVIYHIDIKSKKILQRVKGVDALSLALIKSAKGKQLLFGGARENFLYSLDTKTLKVSKLFELPNVHEHIRKIKVRSENVLELQTIPFSYSLIAQTSQGEDRKYYQLKWDGSSVSWELSAK
ncbi:MAG: Unknown protein [uncultured Sulfurovum sp.]|uniref:Uncharacterized protein n=1 Tax=uncultured Sulfurovum sp. TaxID=269237 RepID=A0A6S6S6P4_9BACT|nr:MAG: Unknown protein [uncultured Sulfurovum sp.]